MPRLFLDSGVLIAAARGEHPLREVALALLGNPASLFLTSPFVYLETMPKAVFHRRALEAEFYRLYFAGAQWHRDLDSIVDRAAQISSRRGLGAMDALHVAAAALLQATTPFKKFALRPAPDSVRASC